MTVDVYQKLLGYCKACEETGCWNWTGGMGGSYKETPVIHLPGTRANKRSMPAYKAAWIFSGKQLNKGQQVYRKCLNKRCVNPDHLAVGTAKQRWAFLAKTGVFKNQPHRILANVKNREKQMASEETVREVRAKLDSGMLHKDVAAEMGISKTLISKIANGTHYHCRPKLLRGASVFSLVAA